jgi:hypothetical protein
VEDLPCRRISLRTMLPLLARSTTCGVRSTTACGIHWICRGTICTEASTPEFACRRTGDIGRRPPSSPARFSGAQ